MISWYGIRQRGYGVFRGKKRQRGRRRRRKRGGGDDFLTNLAPAAKKFAKGVKGHFFR